MRTHVIENFEWKRFPDVYGLRLTAAKARSAMWWHGLHIGA